jgi:hypothetical protein
MLEGRGKPQAGILADWDHATIVRSSPPGEEGGRAKYEHQNYRTVRILSLESICQSS